MIDGGRVSMLNLWPALHDDFGLGIFVGSETRIGGWSGMLKFKGDKFSGSSGTGHTLGGRAGKDNLACERLCSFLGPLRG